MEWWQMFLVGVIASLVSDLCDYIRSRVSGLPTPGQLEHIGRLIRDEARCRPHTTAWFNARDAVGRAAMELAESIRKENAR